MVKKILIASAILISLNLFANEEPQQPVEKCETAYSACLEKCDASSEGQEKEACYDKCDDSYSKCLDSIKTEE